jgi:hypothetical protein
MKNRSILTNKQKLDNLFEFIKDIRELRNLELESQWATYLCIRVSGLLETSVRTIFRAYCGDKAHPYISRYIGYTFEANRAQSMKPETILGLVGSFNINWRDDLENYLAVDGRKEAIESVINIRNSASHGGSSSVSYVNVKQYYEKIWDIIQFIDLQCQNS